MAGSQVASKCSFVPSFQPQQVCLRSSKPDRSESLAPSQLGRPKDLRIGYWLVRRFYFWYCITVSLYLIKARIVLHVPEIAQCIRMFGHKISEAQNVQKALIVNVSEPLKLQLIMCHVSKSIKDVQEAPAPSRPHSRERGHCDLLTTPWQQ